MLLNKKGEYLSFKEGKEGGREKRKEEAPETPMRQFFYILEP